MRGKSVTDRDVFLLGSATVQSQFPVRFNKGPAITGITLRCNCGCEIRPSVARGQLTRVASTVFQLDAVGYCDQCKHLVRYLYRVDEASSMRSFEKTGAWGLWRVHVPLGLRAYRKMRDSIRAAIAWLK